MTIMLFGPTGRLGQTMMDILRQRGHPVLAIPRNKADLLDVDHAKRLIDKTKPEYVINCTACNGLETCSQYPGLAFQVNSVAPGHLAEACARVEATFIHFSTDYVFSGTVFNERLRETDTPKPWGLYGQTKLYGENSALMLNDSTYIFRLSSIYGSAFAGSTGAVYQARHGKGSLDNPIMVLHQFVAPTSTRLISNVIARLLEDDPLAYGLYNLSPRNGVWKKEFSEYILRRCGFPDAIVQEGSLSIPRPVYSLFDTYKLEATFKIKMPTWEDDLNEMMAYLKC